MEMAETQKELAGDVAIVTGAAHNIGRATCLALAEAGAAVCVNAMHSGADAEALAGEIAAAGGQAMHYVADITDPDAVKAMTDAVVARFGKLTILINNAGVRGNTPLDELTLDEWRRVTLPTVEGTMICAQAALPHLRKAGGGTIISLGGIASHSGVAGRTHVAAANTAIIGFMKSLAHEAGGDNIRVNTVVPGHIDTVRGAAAGARPKTDIKFLIQDRMGRPEEVAAMIRALCGLAGSYVTGQTIHVNGGAYLP
jgi:3-oxoacyl-[acyl-carrier protein] reductase